jgi:hypothetical protein
VNGLEPALSGIGDKKRVVEEDEPMRLAHEVVAVALGREHGDPRAALGRRRVLGDPMRQTIRHIHEAAVEVRSDAADAPECWILDALRRRLRRRLSKVELHKTGAWLDVRDPQRVLGALTNLHRLSELVAVQLDRVRDRAARILARRRTVREVRHHATAVLYGVEALATRQHHVTNHGHVFPPVLDHVGDLARELGVFRLLRHFHAHPARWKKGQEPIRDVFRRSQNSSSTLKRSIRPRALASV